MTRRNIALSVAVLATIATSAVAQPPAPAKQSALPAGVAVEQDLAYVPNGHERQKLDLYTPSEQKEGAKPLPVVVWIHGGGWEAGEGKPIVSEAIQAQMASRTDWGNLLPPPPPPRPENLSPPPPASVTPAVLAPDW